MYIMVVMWCLMLGVPWLLVSVFSLVLIILRGVCCVLFVVIVCCVPCLFFVPCLLCVV